MTAVASIVEIPTDTKKTYADFLKEAIIDTVSVLTDEETLSYIHSVLMQAVTAEMQPEGC